MTKALPFTQKLLFWYRRNARDLPWRRTKDPYKIWISEIMLQQTTVNAVIPYYKRWVKEFPSIQSVADAPLQKILRFWQGLGYYQRARNIHKSAKTISKNYFRRIPRDLNILKKLPGFGAYTVGAVLSIAFDYPMTIIDANIRRVVMRQLAIKGRADNSHDGKISLFLKGVLPGEHCGDFNQALMELGALVCRNKEPLCSVCPVKGGCAAYKKGIQEIIPQPKNRRIKEIDVSVAVIKRNNRYFIQKRPSRGLLADLWEFPGGKIIPGETQKQALERELLEELGIRVYGLRHFADVQHFYTQFRVKLHVWICGVASGIPSDKTHRWVRPDDFSKYPMPSGSAKIVDLISSGKVR
ncbi:MAG TPA: A/G-specific adenine glycosylase [Candidatus Omnitrophota bacterium]|nr:A/G-specific adenine glycosylase [Candidatus Omnitrophota bacterium]HPD85469.1 A/G-specific adenine glycosylase [Candidatus Omnitrophota bacterium]HRZ04030.1 A/G-specific adenine glycosylase [Candidatus Omnitrophota bacterium]